MVDKKLRTELGSEYISSTVSDCSTSHPSVENSQRNVQQCSSSNENQKITNLFAIKRGLCTPSKDSPMKKLTRKAPGAGASKRYLPAKGSSGFALLVALLRYELEHAMFRVNKYDLQQMALKYTTTVQTGGPGRSFSGWQTINTLISRELVTKTEERSSLYSLTDEGKKLAVNLALACPDLKGKSS